MRRGKAEATQRQANAVRLRKEGHSYRDIADLLNCSVSTAFTDVQKALEEIRKQTKEDIETIRSLELERLDMMLSAVNPAAMAGDVKAVLATLKIMERRAKLLGLDAPESINVEAINHTEEMREMQRLREQIDAAISANPENRERITAAIKIEEEN